jgi:hypothetical protein
MLRLVAALLMVWEPLRFAGEALQVLPSIGYRGALAAIELLAHAGVAALAAGAGFALWNQAPDARRFATVAVLVLVARAAQSLYWSVLPNNTVPGDEPLTIAVTLAAGALMLAIVRWRVQ